jgi:hypothetical protein
VSKKTGSAVAYLPIDGVGQPRVATQSDIKANFAHSMQLKTAFQAFHNGFFSVFRANNKLIPRHE